jgi:hypothetical protein
VQILGVRMAEAAEVIGRRPACGAPRTPSTARIETAPGAPRDLASMPAGAGPPGLRNERG